jgi:hypothetical protein
MKTKNLFIILICAFGFTGCNNNTEDETSNPSTDPSAQHSSAEGQTEGYIVGYETCGLTVQERTGNAEGYIVITVDLKDTLTVYNLPKGIYDFPVEAFPEQHPAVMNASFPEQFRYKFKIRFAATFTSLEELFELGIHEPCVYIQLYAPIYTYENYIPVIIESASKMD